MKIKFIYWIIPVPVFYTDKLIPKKFSGKSFGVFVCIRPKLKDNETLLKHELIHCKQFYRTLSIHGFLYRFSETYRIKAEVEAYMNSLPNKIAVAEWVANAIYRKYDIKKHKFGYIKKLTYKHIPGDGYLL